jgi:hypothetical protein
MLNSSFDIAYYNLARLKVERYLIENIHKDKYKKEGLQALINAIKLNSHLKKEAKSDQVFKEIRDDKKFKEITEF